jgi:hypothetical protein
MLSSRSLSRDPVLCMHDSIPAQDQNEIHFYWTFKTAWLYFLKSTPLYISVVHSECEKFLC